MVGDLESDREERWIVTRVSPQTQAGQDESVIHWNLFTAAMVAWNFRFSSMLAIANYSVKTSAFRYYR